LPSLSGVAVLLLSGAGLSGRLCRSAARRTRSAPGQLVQVRAETKGSVVVDADEEYASEVEDDELMEFEDEEDEYDDYQGDEEERLEARCKARFVKGSPLKFRRVLWQIRGRSYREALMLLEFLPWRACRATLCCLQSAAANAQNHFNMDKSRLYISRCKATKGPKMRRMRPVSKGQAHMFHRHTTHLTIYVAEMEDEQLDEYS